jgi:predicted dehydrogenase
MMSRLRVAIVGAGRRTNYLYAPLVQMLKDDLELVGIYGRRIESATELGDKFRVAAFDNLDRMIESVRPDLLIISVRNAANGPVGRQVAGYGLPMLQETPIANDLADCDAIVEACRQANAPIEVAEQYYRRPMERIKALLIKSGVVGQVQVAYNDFMGHAYHGVSLIRSYVGFDVPAVRVTAARPSFRVTPHFNSLGGPDNEQEVWEHGLIQFANGAMGVFDWTTIGYGSAIRWQRSTRFLASAGMAVGDEVTTLSADGKHREPIRLERRIHNIGGMETLLEVVAHTNPQIYWRNPFSQYYMDDEMIAVADCVMSLVEAVRTGRSPEYGAANARADQEIYLAIRRSAEQGSTPVELPLGV